MLNFQKYRTCISRKNAFSFSYIKYAGFLSRLNIFTDIFFAFLLVFWHIENKTKKEDFKNGEFGILYKKTDGMLWDSQCETDLFEGKIKIADVPVEFRTRRAYICAHRYARWIGDEKERHHQLWKIAESLEADICNFEMAQTMREHGVPTPEIKKKVGAKIPEESEFFNLDKRLQELILIHDAYYNYPTRKSYLM